MRRFTGFSAVIVLSGCASSVRPVPSSASDREHAPQPPLVVLVEGSDLYYWDGWLAKERDLPSLVEHYHPTKIVLTSMKGNGVQFNDVIQLRYAIIAAGVSDVRIGSGGG